MILFLENLLEKFVQGIPTRRRGRSRQRLEKLVEEIDEKGLEEVRAEHKRKLYEQEVALEELRKEYAIESYLRGVSMSERLHELEQSVLKAEEDMIYLRDEEDFIMVLALAV